MPEPIVIHTEDLNSYGFWMKTEGGDLSRFKKNPVMLWNHHRTWKGETEEVLPIGIGVDLKVEGGKIIITPEFDMDDPFAAKIARKYEKGHIRAASVGVNIIELSEDPKVLKPGQRRATATKWEMREFSLTDIPSNAFAIKLYDQDGHVVNLSDSGECAIPLLNLSSSEDQNQQQMELKILAAQLGLSDSASLADIQTTITQLSQKASQVEGLSAQLKQLKDQIESTRKTESGQLLSDAVTERRITPEQRPHFETLFLKDFDAAKAVLMSLPKLEKLSEQITPEAKDAVVDGKFQGKTFKEMSRSNPKGLEELKVKNFDAFNELFKAEYGKDYRK